MCLQHVCLTGIKVQRVVLGYRKGRGERKLGGNWRKKR